MDQFLGKTAAKVVKKSRQKSEKKEKQAEKERAQRRKAVKKNRGTFTDSKNGLIYKTIVSYFCSKTSVLNISYNAEGIPGKGSAIFLHVFGDRKPYTGGCVSIPLDKMRFVMTHVSLDCVVVINSLENLGGSF